MSTTVKMMLDAKGRAVQTVEPDRKLLEVASVLNEKKIGAVVVAGLEGRIAGIFTERDLVRTIATHGVAALEKPVQTMMTTGVTRCREEQTVEEVMEMMTAGRFRHYLHRRRGEGAHARSRARGRADEGLYRQLRRGLVR